MTLHVIEGDGRAEDVAWEMAERIKALAYEYEGRTNIATAIGVLHIVARDILEEAEG